MSEMKCDVCGVTLTSWSARFGDKETIFCKKCYETDDANTVISNKDITSQSNGGAKEPKIVHESIDAIKQNVIVTDFKMPFESMVVFMVKWAIASIPAMIILFVAFSFLSIFIGGIFS
jgi:hypothetical protein